MTKDEKLAKLKAERREILKAYQERRIKSLEAIRLLEENDGEMRRVRRERS